MEHLEKMSCDGKCQSKSTNPLEFQIAHFLAADNLVQAFALAVHPSARDRGVMITFNDRIGSAFYTSKVSANRLDTFRSHEQVSSGCSVTTPLTSSSLPLERPTESISMSTWRSPFQKSAWCTATLTSRKRCSMTLYPTRTCKDWWLQLSELYVS